MTVVAGNDAPALDLDASGVGTGFAVTFTEDGGAVAIADSDTIIGDVDDATMAGATITLTNPQDGSAESLSLAGALPAGILRDASSTATRLVLTGSASKASYETALELVRYDNSSQNPDPADRIVTVVVNDGADDSNIATTTVTVIAGNDAINLVDVAGGTGGFKITGEIDDDFAGRAVSSAGNLHHLKAHLSQVHAKQTPGQGITDPSDHLDGLDSPHAGNRPRNSSEHGKLSLPSRWVFGKDALQAG